MLGKQNKLSCGEALFAPPVEITKGRHCYKRLMLKIAPFFLSHMYKKLGWGRSAGQALELWCYTDGVLFHTF